MVPTAALFLVDIDANEGFGVRAMNLAQAVVEYDAIPFTKTFIHVVTFCGLLLSPQQSTDVFVPDSALNPAGHAVQTDAALSFENVSTGHVVQELASVAASCG
jgi:hypothetical protein